MDDSLKRALAAAARAFADELERDLPRPERTVVGGAESMSEVLRSVARINDDHGRGANDDEMRAIARRTGMDPRGLAGYYSAGLLEKREDGRWLCADGRERLDRLDALRGMVILDGGKPREQHDGALAEDVPQAGASGASPASRRTQPRH
jgi:DNA-binding transcriptional ArsR family regulator